MDSDSDLDSPVVSRPFAINPVHHSAPPPPAYNVYPGGPHSLSGIAMRAAGLGFAAGVCLFLAFVGGYFQLPFFLFLLSLFHLLEFWTTARYNTPNAKTSCRQACKPKQSALKGLKLAHTLQQHFSSPLMAPRTTSPMVLPS